MLLLTDVMLIVHGHQSFTLIHLLFRLKTPFHSLSGVFVQEVCHINNKLFHRQLYNAVYSFYSQSLNVENHHQSCHMLYKGYL